MTAEQVTEKSARNRASHATFTMRNDVALGGRYTNSSGARDNMISGCPTPWELAAGSKKPSKYRNVKTTVGDQTFDSAKEAKRYGELCLMQSVGKISDLHCQPVIKCIVNGQLVCNYIADFCYLDKRDNFVLKYEDVKSEHTRKLPVYRLKKKLVKALFNVDIIEI